VSPRSPPPHRGALSVAGQVSGRGAWLIHHPSTVDCLGSLRLATPSIRGWNRSSFRQYIVGRGNCRPRLHATRTFEGAARASRTDAADATGQTSVCGRARRHWRSDAPGRRPAGSASRPSPVPEGHDAEDVGKALPGARCLGHVPADTERVCREHQRVSSARHREPSDDLRTQLSSRTSGPDAASRLATAESLRQAEGLRHHPLRPVHARRMREDPTRSGRRSWLPAGQLGRESRIEPGSVRGCQGGR
jgi:hypothetical protein